MISELLRSLAADCERELIPVFAGIDAISRENTEKILQAFSAEEVAERHFNPSSGYGYNDDGRDVADRLFARALDAEAGFVRHNIISGTHALTIGLFGLLRPGDTMLAVTGRPYDTLEGVIGFGGVSGSLMDFGVKYEEIELVDQKTLDLDAIRARLMKSPAVKVVYAQRSKGYSARRTLTADELTALYETVHSVSDAFVFVDNCYGEFTALHEPKADLLVGSLIKNAGGGLAESGGYLVGAKKAVRLAAERLTVPTIGLEAGATLGQNKPIIKGLFFAPHIVGNAMKTAHFAALLFEKLGYKVNPSPFEPRQDIIQIISLGSEKNMIAFCRGLQSGSPVDSNASPEPSEMPGYEDKIIMAAGAFTQGSSIELSADGPIRPPFDIYLQGGLTYESGRYGVLCAAQSTLDAQRA